MSNHLLQPSHFACTSTSTSLALEGYTGVAGGSKKWRCSGDCVLVLRPQATQSQLAVVDTLW